MFGLIHYINLLSQPDNLMGITSQVFFATSIGVFFCGLMMRTENILLPGFIHALVNFSFGASELNQVLNENPAKEMVDKPSSDWNSLIPTAIFFSLIFLGGIYMLLQADQESILKKHR